MSVCECVCMCVCGLKRGRMRMSKRNESPRKLLWPAFLSLSLCSYDPLKRGKNKPKGGSQSFLVCPTMGIHLNRSKSLMNDKDVANSRRRSNVFNWLEKKSNGASPHAGRDVHRTHDSSSTHNISHWCEVKEGMGTDMNTHNTHTDTDTDTRRHKQHRKPFRRKRN